MGRCADAYLEIFLRLVPLLQGSKGHPTRVVVHKIVVVVEVGEGGVNLCDGDG